MDIKKDWNKIVYVVLFLIGAVFFALAVFNMDGANFASLSLYVAGLIYFVGAIAYVICKMLKLDCAKYVILAIGVINTILACVFLFGDLGGKTTGLNIIFDMPATFAAPYVTMILVFALFPLVKGIKKMFVKEEIAA